jgi:hypothetical protein
MTLLQADIIPFAILLALIAGSFRIAVAWSARHAALLKETELGLVGPQRPADGLAQPLLAGGHARNT